MAADIYWYDEQPYGLRQWRKMHIDDRLGLYRAIHVWEKPGTAL